MLLTSVNLNHCRPCPTSKTHSICMQPLFPFITELCCVNWGLFLYLSEQQFHNLK